MRIEDELARMVRGSNPMAPPEQPPTDMPPGPPADSMMDAPPPMLDEPPMEDDPMMEPDLPGEARVIEVSGNTVVLEDNRGQQIELPLSSFPIKPQEGMQMVQATVQEMGEDIMVALVGPEQMPIELPLDTLEENFAPGDYFWMPAPPQGPDAMMEDPMAEEMLEPPMDEPMDMPPMDDELMM